MRRRTARERTIARYTRMRRVFWRSTTRMGAWGLFSYAFVFVYVELYGSQPVLVERLGTTLAVLCGAIAAWFFAGAVVVGSIGLLHTWRFRRGSWT